MGQPWPGGPMTFGNVPTISITITTKFLYYKITTYTFNKPVQKANYAKAHSDCIIILENLLKWK